MIVLGDGHWEIIVSRWSWGKGLHPWWDWCAHKKKCQRAYSCPVSSFLSRFSFFGGRGEEGSYLQASRKLSPELACVWVDPRLQPLGDAGNFSCWSSPVHGIFFTATWAKNLFLCLFSCCRSYLRIYCQIQGHEDFFIFGIEVIYIPLC